MAFFEQFGKRITDVGQGAAQQAENLADITRLSGMVSEKEKQISRLYGEIGKQYYERHRDDPEAEELKQVRQIAALSEEIAKCKESMKQLRGITKCPECGGDVAPGAAFCKECGAPMGGRKPRKAAPAYLKKKPAGGKNRTTGIAAIALVLIIVVLGVCSLGGRSYKSTVKKFVKASFEADGKVMLTLMPDKVVDDACEEGHMTQKELAEALSDSLSDALEDYEDNFDKWKYSFEITESEDYSKKEVRSLSEDYEDEFDLKVKDGKQVSVKVTVTADDYETSMPLRISLVKIGKSWYVDVLGMGGLF